MVSVIASNIKNRREYRDLCDLFDRTDSSGDGRLSLAEFMAACNHCGVTITEEELAGFASIAKNGEVTVTRGTPYYLTSLFRSLRQTLFSI